MPSNDEIYKIILRTEGQEQLKDLTAQLKNAEQRLRDIVQAGGSSSQSAKNYAANIASLSAQIKSTEKDLARLGKTSGSNAQLLMSLGYAADDAQYGMKGLSNNIQPILSQIPALAGLAPVISIAAIAAYQLYEHWDQIASLWGQGHTKTEAEEMDALGKATKRTADEEERYQKLKERAKHAEAQNKEPEAVTERKDAIDKAIANGPKAELEKDVDRIFKKHIQTMAELDPRYQAAAQFKRDFGSAGGKTVNPNGTPISPRDQARNAANQKKADEDLSAIYGDARTKFMADLGNEDQKGNLKRLAEGATSQKNRDALKEAGKTPEQRQDEQDGDDDWRLTMEENSKRAEREEAQRVKERDEEEARRVKERDEEEAGDEFERKRDEADRNRLAQFQEEGRKAEESKAAGMLSGGKLGRLAATGKLTNADVAKGLQGLGHSEEEVDNMLPGVADHLRTQGDDTAKKLAAERGISVDEARGQILAEQYRPIGEAFKNHQETVQSIFSKANDHGPSQVIDTAGLANAIQASVGVKDPQIQMLDELKKANETLLRFLNKPENRALILNT